MDWRDLYLSSGGRLDRRQYWLASLPLLGAELLAEIAIRSQAAPGFFLFDGLVYLAILMPSIAITIKRLHDRGRSGWFMLVAAIPLLGAVWLAIQVGVLAGVRGANRFGPDPLEPARADRATSATAPV